MKRKCIIENAQFSYILRVDNQKILFNGSDNADYFEEHYKKLGYEVERKCTLQILKGIRFE